MKPIKVQISNFQAIKNVEFQIKGFTCIVGRTNVGKSAIIRAISGAILNTPLTNMIRHGEKLCTVRLKSEEWGFKWEKAEKGTNKYTIDGKEEVLSSVGRGQIEEVSAFGFSSVKIGESKYLNPWYASQFDPIFLLNQSGPSITDFISEVSRLDVLQNSIVLTNKKKKRHRDKSKLIEADLKELRKKKEKFAKLEEIKQVRDDLQSQRDSILDYENRVSQCKKFLTKILSVSESISLFDDIEDVVIPQPIDTKEIEIILTLNDYKQKLKSAAASIIKIREIKDVAIPKKLPDSEFSGLEKACAISDRLKRVRASVKKLSGKIRVPDAVQDDQLQTIQRVSRLNNRIQATSQSLAKLSSKFEIPDIIEEIPVSLVHILELQKSMDENREKIKRLNTLQEQNEQELNKVNEEISRIPKCPTCERPWNPRTEDH